MLALHPNFGFRIIHQRIEVFLDLSNAQDFFNSGLAVPHLVPAVRAQGAHAKLHRFLSNGRGGRAIQDKRPETLV